ncbi:ATP-binding protein [Cellulomonas sp. Y8]|uniref:ATP-binding protein n=1 Tax=Cellulomonas sp. Y8 TaxID=2591145 RepID=UPI00143D07AF|nr:ATP-binding protein [Cellulomonas sp. Y8]
MHGTSRGDERAFPSSASSLARARAWSMERASAAGAPVEVVDAVQLAMSEAFTNALRHAPGTRTITVSVVGARRQLTYEVGDAAAAVLPRRRSNRDGLPGGHGLHILDAVTSAWGWRPAPDGGKVVWFSLRW